MSEKIEKLEMTVMELGAETYRLKLALNQLQAEKDHAIAVLNQIQHLLDEKGIIDTDEIDISEHLELLNSAPHDHMEDDISEDTQDEKVNLH